jgi:hypothetical protein
MQVKEERNFCHYRKQNCYRPKALEEEEFLERSSLSHVTLQTLGE